MRNAPSVTFESFRSYRVLVLAAKLSAKLEQAWHQCLLSLPHPPHILHTQESEWEALLYQSLIQNSLWEEHSFVVIRMDDKQIKRLNQAWFHTWLEQDTAHHLIILLENSYASSHTFLKHPRIRSVNLYDQTMALSPQDQAYIGQDPASARYLKKLKSQQPQAYAQWLALADPLNIAANLASLESYAHSEDSLIFLTWVEAIHQQIPLPNLLKLKTSEVMECFSMVSSWLRQALLHEQHPQLAPHGLMRWPQVKDIWDRWRLHENFELRMAWYLAWIEQEAALKGLAYPLHPSQGWQACVMLSQRLQRCLYPS